MKGAFEKIRESSLELEPEVRKQVEDLSRAWSSMKYSEQLKVLASLFKGQGERRESFAYQAAKIIFPYKDIIQATSCISMLIETALTRNGDLESGRIEEEYAMVIEGRQHAKETIAAKEICVKPKSSPVKKKAVAKSRRTVERALIRKQISEKSVPQLSAETADELMKGLEQKWSSANLRQKIIDMKSVVNYAKNEIGIKPEPIADMVMYFSGMSKGEILPIVELAIKFPTGLYKHFEFNLANDVSVSVLVQLAEKLEYDIKKFARGIGRSAKKNKGVLCHHDLMRIYHDSM